MQAENAPENAGDAALSSAYDLSGRMNAWSVRFEKRRLEKREPRKVDSRRTYSASEIERMMKQQDVLLKAMGKPAPFSNLPEYQAEASAAELFKEIISEFAEFRGISTAG
jgi:hypothetical protein